MSDFGQGLIDRGVKPIRGSWEFDGQEKDLDVKPISYPDWKLVQQYAALSARIDSLDSDDVDESDIEDVQKAAEQLGDFSWEGEDTDVDWIVTAIENNLVNPDVDPRTDPLPITTAIIQGMIEAWQESPRVAEAKDEMPVDEGNG